MLAHAPIFNELDKRHIPAITQRSHQEPQAGACFALAFAGVHHYHIVFRFVVFKGHKRYRCYALTNFFSLRAASILGRSKPMMMSPSRSITGMPVCPDFS